MKSLAPKIGLHVWFWRWFKIDYQQNILGTHYLLNYNIHEFLSIISIFRALVVPSFCRVTHSNPRKGMLIGADPRENGKEMIPQDNRITFVASRISIFWQFFLIHWIDCTLHLPQSLRKKEKWQKATQWFQGSCNNRVAKKMLSDERQRCLQTLYLKYRYVWNHLSRSWSSYLLLN